MVPAVQLSLKSRFLRLSHSVLQVFRGMVQMIGRSDYWKKLRYLISRIDARFQSAFVPHVKSQSHRFDRKASHFVSMQLSLTFVGN